MERLRPSAALWLAFLQLLGSFRLGSCTFDCPAECFGPYQFSFFPVSSCEVISDVLDCYSTHQQECDQQESVFFFLGRAQTDFHNNGCTDPNDPDLNTSITTTTTTTPENQTTITPSPSPDPCPSLPNIYNANLSLSMANADISPRYQPIPECTMTQVDGLRQCSLFMDSQLRAFNSYRGGLETCSLPGTWYLLRHPGLSIEVEGTNLEIGSNHTRLTKVNVTFHSDRCNTEERTYIAYNTEPLPSQFMPALAESEGSPLQVMYGRDQSVVTLMATWLNTTIIIRQYSGFLSVTLQVPREMSLVSEGLCTGCPSHMYVNLTSFFDRIPSLCPRDNDKALNSCFDYGGVANEEGLEHIHNNSYLEACVFNLFKTKTSEVLTMINGIADDAKLLVNTGLDPRPIYTPSPSSPHQPTPSDAMTHSSTEISFGTSSHSSTLTVLLPIVTLSIFR